MQFKNYILKWSDNYQLIFQKSRLLSQIPIFVIAVVMLCEIFDVLRHIIPKDDPDWNHLLKFTIGSLTIILPLVIRFLLLFSKSKRSFWLSQFFWLINFAWFRYYFKMRSSSACLYTDEALMFFYLIGSSVRQFVSLAISFIPIPEKKF